jgi:hypothetical protein
MEPYRKVAALAREDAAYIAGLVDGEGTITLSRRHRHDARQLVVSIANVSVRNSRLRAIAKSSLETASALKLSVSSELSSSCNSLPSHRGFQGRQGSRRRRRCRTR